MSNWLEVLNKECQRRSRAKVAKMLGCSTSSVSQVLAGTYPSKPMKLKRLVLNTFCGTSNQQYVQPSTKVNTPILLEIIDFIFCHSTVGMDELKAKFNRQKAERALKKLAERDLLVIYEEPRQMKGRPQKFYRLRCACFAPGLMPSCPECPLGSLILNLDKDIPKEEEVHDDDC